MYSMMLYYAYIYIYIYIYVYYIWSLPSRNVSALTACPEEMLPSGHLQPAACHLPQAKASAPLARSTLTIQSRERKQ